LGIEEANEILIYIYIYNKIIMKKRRNWKFNILVWLFAWFSVHFYGTLSTLCLLLTASDWRIFVVFWEWFWGGEKFNFEWNSAWKEILTEIWGCIFCNWGLIPTGDKLNKAVESELFTLEILFL